VVIDKILLLLEKKGKLALTPDTQPETSAPPPANLLVQSTFGMFHDLRCCRSGSMEAGANELAVHP
jgi:hypothetical protein